MESKNSSDKSSFASGSTLFGSLNNFSYADDEAGHAVSRHQSYEQQHFQEFCYLDDMYLDIMSPPFHSCEDEIRRIIGVESKDAELIEPKRSRADVSPSEPFEVLRKYGRNPPLSFEKIIKLAAELVQFQSVSEGRNELSFLNHQFSSSILILSDEDSKEVRLVQNVISCAEKVAAKQYECAVRFLKECDEMSSATGTPVQRLAFYISEALFEKITKGTGKWENPKRKVMNPLEPARLVNSMPTYFKKFPVTQITNLVGSHTILRYLEGARKIHIVDLEIRSGVQWVQLMQDVAARRSHSIHHLKITAVGTQSESILVETGKQLAIFAESVNLKFTFKIVMVEDILDLHLDLFNLNADESVAVYAAYTLLTMIGRADRLDHLMGVIRDLNPHVMVVTEMEANCNSPHYAERFLESLFLFGALFDSLSDCMKDHETSRMDIESTLFRSSINNVLAAEGDEMVLRHAPINVWRDVLAGFGLVETEISFTSLKQANLLLQHSITLCRNGRCLTVGWKGTPLTSLSAWKSPAEVISSYLELQSFEQMNSMSHDENSDFSTVCDDSPMSKFSQLVGNNDSSNAREEDVGIAIPHFHQKRDQESMDRLFLDVVSPPFQDECIEAKNRQNCVFSMESFEVLRKYGSRRLKQEGKSPSTNREMLSDQASSTEMTIRLAAEKFIHSTNGRSSDLSTLNHPYPSYLLPHCGENSEGVGLIQNLLLCAEKVADNQYERALKFLKDCDKKSLSTGTPIQRLVFYFSQALFEKIANETGRILVRDLEENNADPIESVLFPSMNLLISFHKEHPLAQMTKLVGVQAILDHVEGSRKVHVIDLQIRSGVQWIILMQDLAARTEHPIQLLKITAVRTKRESTTEETGRQLVCFARSLNLNFTFKTVTVDDFSDLNITLFDLDADESVAVYAPYILSMFVGRINELDHLMRTMKNINPSVMIVTELEVNCNSPTFIERFVECLFFHGAFFDSLEDCFKNDETSRANAESSWFGSGIRNILVADGDHRRLRHVNVSVWRAFFARFEVSEMELSSLSVDQACIGVQSLGCGRSCTLYRDDMCLIIGWKGTPLSFVSAWKF